MNNALWAVWAGWISFGLFDQPTFATEYNPGLEKVSR
jgi:hypothetical protein